MKLLPAAVCSATLVVSAAIAQTTPPSISLVTDAIGLLQRHFPDGVGAETAVQVVRFDPDGDLLHDLAIRWDGGAITYCNAPEVMAAFTNWPVAEGGAPDASSMVQIPAAFAMAGTLPHDALLVANGTALRYLTYDPVSARSIPGATGFAAAPVQASPAWQQVVMVETYASRAALWVFGLARDEQQVLVGEWTPAGIVEVGSFVAGGAVQQLLGVDFGNDGAVQIAVRTPASLEFRTPTGALARPPIAAPTANPIGFLARLRNGDELNVAWLVNSGFQWKLRVYDSDSELQDELVVAPGILPARFRPVGLGAVAWGGSCDALVIAQNTTEVQLVLAKNGPTFQAVQAFGCPGMTYPNDRCPPLFDDLNHDGQQDFTMVQSAQDRVQIRRNLAPPGGSFLVPGSGGVDILAGGAFLSEGPTGVLNATINLGVKVPLAYYETVPDLEVQVVSWPQYVSEPGLSTGVNDPVGDADANWYFPLVGNSGNIYGPQPILPVLLPRTTDNWLPKEHRYLMIRFVRRASGTLIWTSPAHMMAFVAKEGSAPAFPDDLTYLYSISTPGEHEPVVVPGGNRNVGVILRPASIDPPNSSLKVPNSGAGAQREPAGSW